VNLAPNSTFVLISVDAGADVTAEWITKCAAAIDSALQTHVKWHWGGNYHCRSGAVNATIGPNEVKVSLQASSDVQGAAGYHDDGGIYCFRDGLPDLDSGAFAYSVVISHEIFETVGDPGANRWAQDATGTLYGLELCDACEGYFWLAPNGVALSDFVLPAFFDPSAGAPYSYTAKPTAPLTTAPDNGSDYQITQTAGSEAQVTADRPSPHGSRASAKAHPSSRTSRRLRAVSRQ
jgi:hypothetical protein